MCQWKMGFHNHKYASLKLFVLLYITSFASASTCPPKCVCTTEESSMYCDGIGLEALPKGSWPSVQYLSIVNNAITEMKDGFFTSFPNLQVLFMDENPMKKLNMEVFTVLSNFSLFSCVKCQIEEIVPLSAGKELPFLSSLYLGNNSITKVPENLLDGISGDTLALELRGNPLLIPGDRPFLTSGFLKILDLSFNNCSRISFETFRGLRNLDILDLGLANISKITNQFKYLDKLQHLILYENPIKELRGTILPPNLQSISLRNTNLQFVDLEVVDRAFNLTYIDIDDTPMACNCTFQALFNWAQSRDVMLNALCSDNVDLTCPFYNRTSYEYSDNMTYNNCTLPVNLYNSTYDNDTSYDYMSNTTCDDNSYAYSYNKTYDSDTSDEFAYNRTFNSTIL